MTGRLYTLDSPRWSIPLSLVCGLVALYTLLLFLWLAYWGWAWGVVGLILAFPMVTGLKIALEHIEATRGWAALLSDE